MNNKVVTFVGNNRKFYYVYTTALILSTLGDVVILTDNEELEVLFNKNENNLIINNIEIIYDKELYGIEEVDRFKDNFEYFVLDYEIDPLDLEKTFNIYFQGIGASKLILDNKMIFQEVDEAKIYTIYEEKGKCNIGWAYTMIKPPKEFEDCQEIEMIDKDIYNYENLFTSKSILINEISTKTLNPLKNILCDGFGIPKKELKKHFKALSKGGGQQ